MPLKKKSHNKWTNNAHDRLIGERLIQLRSRREDLDVYWDDDLPVISRLIDVSVEELQRYRHEKREKAKK